MLNLDTHILVYALQNNLRAQIVLWGLTKLSQLGRITLDLDPPNFTLPLSRIRIWPLDLRICLKITELDFRSDQADEIIPATSIVHNVPLLTCDKKILDSELVPIAK